MGVGYAAIQRGEGLPVVVGGAACYSAGSVTTLSIAFKIVVVSEPYKIHLILKTGHGRFAIHQD
jgi:hypothetical protein